MSVTDLVCDVLWKLAWGLFFGAVGAGLAWYVGFLWSTFGGVFGQ